MKKILKRHWIPIVSILTIIIVCMVFGFMFYSLNIGGKMISYKKIDDYLSNFSEEGFYSDAEFYMNMSNETIEDVWEHKENYTGYFIRIEIQNKSNNSICDVCTKLSKTYDNLWLDSASISEYTPLYIGAKEKYNRSIIIIVKTENMNDNEIDELIKSIGVTICARNYEWLPIYASKTIYFEKSG